jgi:hypothetical protein
MNILVRLSLMWEPARCAARVDPVEALRAEYILYQ